MIHRRLMLHLTGLGLLALTGAGAARAQVDVKAILDDPEAPVGGDPKGDVTIVAFLDYNCPFCKKATPELDAMARRDGHVRLVYKDWPILSQTSVHGAKLALAAGYQGRYGAAHAALMAMSGRRRTEDDMTQAVAAAGVDMTRLQADLDAHDAEITALLKRNGEQAEALGLQGTPVFLVGPYKIAQPLDRDGFAKVVAQVRAGARR